MDERDIMGLGKILVPNYMCTWFHYTHLIHVWFICLQLPWKSTIHVGKYTSPMDGMGYMTSISPRTGPLRCPDTGGLLDLRRSCLGRRIEKYVFKDEDSLTYMWCVDCTIYSYILFCCGCLVFYFFSVIYTHVHLLYANLTKCPDKWINQYIHIRSYYIRFPPWFGNWMVLCVTTCLKQMCWMRRFLSLTIWKFQLAWLSACSP